MQLFTIHEKASREETFWQWFSANSSKIFYYEEDADKISAEIEEHIKQVNPSLTFEISPINGYKRNFAISAGGNLEAFDAVKQLYDVKPNFDEWTISKFKQRQPLPLSVTIANRQIKPEDVKYMFAQDKTPHKVGIVLFFKDYCEEQKSEYKKLALSYIDKLFGEHDVAVYIGDVYLQNMKSQYISESKAISEATGEFDNIKLLIAN